MVYATAQRDDRIGILKFSQDIVVDEGNTIAYWASTGVHTLYAVDVTDKTVPQVLTSISGTGPPNFLKSVAHLELSPDDSLLFATSYRDHHHAPTKTVP